MRRVLITAAVITALTAGVLPVAPAGAALANPFSSVALNTTNVGRVHLSSPTVADVDGNGVKDIVIGDLNGDVSVINGASPTGALLWRRPLQIRPGISTAIESSPTVADLDNDGSMEVIVTGGSLGDGSRNPWPAQPGGVAVFNRDGTQRWSRETLHIDNGANYGQGVITTPAVGDVNGDGFPDIVYAGWDQRIYAKDRNGNDVATPFVNTDSVWASPALYSVMSDGVSQIFIGGDAHGYGGCYGGFLRALQVVGGRFVEMWPAKCMGQIFQSSPAIGDIDGDGRPEMVIGSGTYSDSTTPNDYINHPDTVRVFAFHLDDGSAVPGWPRSLNGPTMGAPALGDVDGNGKTDVVIAACAGCFQGNRWNSTGMLWALRGDGSTIWSVNPGNYSFDELISSPALADLNSDGANDVVIGRSGSIHILNGVNGQPLFTAQPGSDVYQNAPAIADFGGGLGWRIVVAGRPGNTGIAHGNVTAFALSAAPRSTPWPMWGKSADHVRAPIGPVVPPTTGYWLAAGDGGIFPFGTAPFYGSTGNVRLNQPVVGMAAPPDGRGYFLVAADGGVFPFGNVRFWGSTGNVRLNQPIVGMASTPSGNGYWLVARDGGVFQFGDAPFYGSTGNVHLNQPIVGMASSQSGHGYWLVAADGGIFQFGDAPFLGSTGNVKLNQPIVGMARRPAANGYWLVASDGGIFQFGNAPFYGSTGNVRLNQPIVGVSPKNDGNGYWLVARDGGVFPFNAPFNGSTGNRRLNQPVLGIATAP